MPVGEECGLRGSHGIYECPCGQHVFTLPDGHTKISPGVVRKADAALAACDEER
ncbi:hypothetical protein GCM10029976_087970 [Kribbella albertanoniae]